MQIVQLDEQNSQAADFLRRLRDKDMQRDPFHFRHALKMLAILQGYELSKQMEYEQAAVTTPLGTGKLQVPSRRPVILGVLRAAMPMVEGLQELFPESQVGFIGSFRSEAEAAVDVLRGYEALPDLTHKTVIICDPMLATGSSMIDAVQLALERGAGRVLMAVIIAAPEGVQALSERFSEQHLLCCWSLDRQLNQKSYIVPGLGDAGDLAFGPKFDPIEPATDG